MEVIAPGVHPGSFEHRNQIARSHQRLCRQVGLWDVEKERLAASSVHGGRVIQSLSRVNIVRDQRAYLPAFAALANKRVPDQSPLVLSHIRSRRGLGEPSAEKSATPFGKDLPVQVA